MKVIIAGSRTVTDINLVIEAIEESGFKITEVVSGTTKGVDRLGEQWAAENDIPIQRMPADWNDINHPEEELATNVYGELYWKRAGMERNRKMAEYAEALIAIIHNNSPGTRNMIGEAQMCDLQVYVKRV